MKWRQNGLLFCWARSALWQRRWGTQLQKFKTQISHQNTAIWIPKKCEEVSYIFCIFRLMHELFLLMLLLNYSFVELSVKLIYLCFRCREWLRAIGDPALAKCTWKHLTSSRFICKEHFLEQHISATQRTYHHAVPVNFPEPRSPLCEEALRDFEARFQ